MKKYLSLIYIAISTLAFGQFQDNDFEKNKPFPQQDLNASTKPATDGTPNGDGQSSLGVPGPGEQEEGPGNPGEPVPIDRDIPLLLITGASLIILYRKKNKKVNI